MLGITCGWGTLALSWDGVSVATKWCFGFSILSMMSHRTFQDLIKPLLYVRHMGWGSASLQITGIQVTNAPTKTIHCKHIARLLRIKSSGRGLQIMTKGAITEQPGESRPLRASSVRLKPEAEEHLTPFTYCCKARLRSTMGYISGCSKLTWCHPRMCIIFQVHGDQARVFLLINGPLRGTLEIGRSPVNSIITSSSSSSSSSSS